MMKRVLLRRNGAAQEDLPPHFRHNFIAFLVDYVFFGVAFSLANLSTVMPAFVRTLTNLEPLVGLVGTIFDGGWLLPQLGTAAIIGSRPRKKPVMVAALYVARPAFLVLALATWWGLPDRPLAMLLVTYTLLAVFAISDSVCSVAWFDIVARAIPLSRRGRLFGSAQVLSRLLGLAAGGLVGVILVSPVLPYPNNYALIFALAFLAHVPSMVALLTIREPPGRVAKRGRSPRVFLRQLQRVWREDARFRRLIGVRWLVGLMSLSLPFYILHAIEVVGLPEAVTGWFVSAQMVGGAVGSLGLGWLIERRGPFPAILLGAIAALASPLLALTLHFFDGSRLAYLYPLVYAFVGVIQSTWMLGVLNSVLEIAPDEQRPVYVGLYNTLAGLLVPVSFLGGVLLRATSYPVLFTVTAVAVASGLIVSLGLRNRL